MKSMINEAKLTKRYNTGEYEFEEYSLGAVVDERESGVQVLKELKLQINEAFTGEKSTEAAAEPETKTEKKADKKAKKEKKKDAKPSDSDDDADGSESESEDASNDDDESVADDEASDDAASDDSDGESDDSSEDESEEDAKPAKKGKGKEEPAAKEKGKGKFKKKPQVYNRGIEQHKEIFSGLLRSVSPDWKKSDKTKALAKNTSAEMEGENFLDENGEVLAEFKAAVVKHMKSKK